MAKHRFTTGSVKVLETFFGAQTAYPEKMTTCKKCGASGLAWVQNNSGKWYLAHAIYARRDDGSRELVANKAYWHRCEDTAQAHADQEKMMLDQVAENEKIAQSENDRLELVNYMRGLGLEISGEETTEKLALILLRATNK